MNKLNYVFLVVFFLLVNTLYSQVGIGNTNPNSLLDISASNIASPSSNDGILIPRVNNFPLTNPAADQNAMMLYLNSNLTGININGTAKNYSSGFYYWNHTLTDWITMTQKPAWHIEGNDDAISGTHFIGTTNTEEVDFKVNNKLVARLTELGQFELQSDNQSVFIGFEAGENYNSSVSENNVFVGYQAGKSTDSGSNNNAFGANALTNNTDGEKNVAMGTDALKFNDGGSDNVAIGNEAMRDNISGIRNTAIGKDALFSNTIGHENVALGKEALKVSLSGNRNTALGRRALENNLSGSVNTIVGYRAGGGIHSGDNNICIGNRADVESKTINRAIVIGQDARVEEDESLAIGTDSQSLGVQSVAIGYGSIVNNDNSSAFGNLAITTKDNQIVLGNTSITEVLTSGVMNADSFLATGTGTTYADYVFEDYYEGFSKIKSNYAFNKLEDAEAFVKENGHLPGVKSYAEVMKNGFKLDLTEATITNLEKIEEQFLYITELKKEIKNQDITNQNQEEKIKSLEERLIAVEKLLNK